MSIPSLLVASIDNPLEVFFDLVPTGAALYAPVYDEYQELVDFRFARLNPAGQRLLGLPAQPPRTFREYYPDSVSTGVFDQYRTAYLTGQAATYDVPHAGPGPGPDTYFRLVAQRSGELLVVNFTDLGDPPRAEVEQALRERLAHEQAARAEAQRQRLYTMLEQFPAVVASYRGPEHVFELVSERFQQDFPTRTIKGLPVRQALPELESQHYYEILDGVYQTGEPFYGTELETWVDLTGTGKLELQYYTVYFQATRDAAGCIDGCLKFAYNVTAEVVARQQAAQLTHELEARVQERTSQLEAAQAATERQRRQWYELFRQAPAGICIFDGPEWVYEFINPGYQALFPGRALLGKRLVDALPEVADQPLMAILHHVYDTGEPFEASEVLVPLARTEDGPVEDIYFDLTYQARRDETGQIDGFVTYAYDVTAQVLARRAREAQQGELQRIFEQAPVAIGLYAGDELRVTALNSRMADLFGRPPAHMLGRPLLDALPELLGQGFDNLLRQVQQTRVPFVGQEMPVTLTRNGETRVTYYNFVYQPLYDADGQVLGVIDVTTEVTEQVLARRQVQDLNQELAAINEELQASNEELNESNRQLTRTNVDLDTFVYTASHDLKAPITNIESIVLALRDTLPAAVQQDEIVAHLLDLLNQTVARFQLTIGQLTDISRLQLAHAGPAEPVNLATVVEDVCLDLAPAIRAANAQLSVEVAPALRVSFSPANLRSIVYNLLSNAVKYRAFDRPAQVRVRAAQTPQAVVLTVQDNGLGMSAVQQRQLFGLFQRLHTHVEGTGVGLYITKRLVENAGGTIAVQSQPDVGTTFTVSFPV
ncbi:PAS domain-containing protein [Hymenobacter bucti]|uniref:histidine kinase n=1 Tax=Hymenobacter bucti TaxID=1844114 RepID=A0ABW4QSV1_9BACT